MMAACRGASLVELLVALLLLSVVSLAVTTALVAAQRADASNARLMRAVLLAASCLERWQARLPVDADEDGFRVRLVATATDVPGVLRGDVTVRWQADGERALQLSTLAWFADEGPAEVRR